MKKISDGKKLFDLAKRTFEVGGVRGERMAVKLLKKSVSLGYLPAFESLAGFYRNGIGISRPDYAKSVMLLRQFVKQCQSCGAYMDLAWCYSHGYGVARSKVMAFKLYRLAARLGEPNAMFNIGLFFERGEGCEKTREMRFCGLENQPGRDVWMLCIRLRMRMMLDMEFAGTGNMLLRGIKKRLEEGRWMRCLRSHMHTISGEEFVGIGLLPLDGIKRRPEMAIQTRNGICPYCKGQRKRPVLLVHPRRQTRPPHLGAWHRNRLHL